MPLIKGTGARKSQAGKSVVSKNIATEIRAGKSRKQAIAIALSQAETSVRRRRKKKR